MDNKIAPLKVEIVAGTNLYECEHLTARTYPQQTGKFGIAVALPLGPHNNIIVCRNCWAGIKSVVLETMLEDMLRMGKAPKDIIRELLKEAAECQNP